MVTWLNKNKAKEIPSLTKQKKTITNWKDVVTLYAQKENEFDINIVFCTLKCLKEIVERSKDVAFSETKEKKSKKFKNM